jgi:hypothetical protein
MLSRRSLLASNRVLHQEIASYVIISDIPGCKAKFQPTEQLAEAV